MSTKNAVMYAAVVLFSLAGCGSDNTNLQRPALSTTDSAFIVGATQASDAEIAAAKLALTRSTNTAVLGFANEMITDHTGENAALAPIATNLGVAVPTNVNATQAAVAASLMPLTGPAFDKAYIDSEITGHEANLGNNYQPELASGTNASIKGYATKYEPQVQSHLQMAQTIAQQNNF